MTNESVHGICSFWQQSSGEPPRFNPEEFHRKVNAFESTIRRRNLGEYVAAALVMGVFAFYGWIFPTSVLRLGCGLIIAGTAYVIYQLHHRASVHRAPADLGLQSCVDFQRAELTRQRDALKSVWSWYLLPFLPGMCVFLFGLFQFTVRVTEAAGRQFRTGAALAGFSIVAGCVAIVFVAVWLLNQRAAKKLQVQIDDLDRVSRDSL